MNREVFFGELRQRLSGLPKEDIEERLTFYSEMIDDRIEDGMEEEDAVASVGNVDDIVAQIMSEIPLTKLVREKVKPKRHLKAWEIVLLILGAPVWVPLVFAAAVVLLAGYVVIWAVVVSVYAVDFSMAAGALAGIAGMFLYIRETSLAGAAFSLGAGCVCAGLAILLFFACIVLTKGVLTLTGKALLGIKSAFVGKEA